jgi:RND family efflux transporter MFP subunit
MLRQPAPIAALTRLAHLESAALVLVLALGCGGPPTQGPAPPAVTVVQPVEREVTEWDEYTARLDAVESVEVRPRVSGYLQSIHFKDGALVTKGDLLFLIDPRPYEAALRRAQADVQLAKSRVGLAQKNLARVGGLLPSHAISQEEADLRESTLRQAEASVLEAQAALDAATLEVEFTHITAPVSGRIGRKLVTEGNLITGGADTQGTLLTTIVSLDPIYAYFDADERSFLKYARLALSGQRPSSRVYQNPVRVALTDEKDFSHEGVMDFVDNQLDRGTGTIIGRAVLPNPDLTLTPGLFARLRLPGSGEYRALLLPDEAVGTDQSKKFVFVVNGESKAEYRAVTTGPLIDGLRVVRDGLTPQDWVIVGGTQRVRPGLTVAAQRQSSASPPAVQNGGAVTPAADGRETPSHARG